MSYIIAPECDEADIRLVNDYIEGDTGLVSSDGYVNSTIEGRVEICFNGVWGTVCDEEWDTLKSEIVCRQLNLTSDCESVMKFCNCTVFFIIIQMLMLSISMEEVQVPSIILMLFAMEMRHSLQSVL